MHIESLQNGCALHYLALSKAGKWIVAGLNRPQKSLYTNGVNDI